MIKVAYASIRDLSPTELAQLPAPERERHFGSAERRRQFRCGRWLLRSVLSQARDGSLSSHRIVTGENGKPVCEGGPAVSISHTAEYVACCIADEGQVGIDVEAINLKRHAPRVARRFFSSAEADWLEMQPEDRFFALWVLKEAYVKALGCGIFGGVNGLQCIVEPPLIRILKCKEATLGLRLFRTGDNYLGLAGTRGLPEDIRIERRDAAHQNPVDDSHAVLVAST